MEKTNNKQVNIKSMTREDLENAYRKLEAKAEADSQELAWYKEMVELQKKKLFGKSSEKVATEQISLFDEAEVESTMIKIEPQLEEIVYKRKKKGKHHGDISKLPTEVIEYKLDEEDQECPTCGEALHVMSKVIQKELVYVPAKLKVIEHVKYVYGCRNCEATGIESTIITAQGPNPVIKGSIASSSLLSQIATDKFDRALPLYRQEVHYKRMGIELSRQTMSNWMIKISENYFKQINKYMHEELLKMEYLMADETKVNVLHEPGKEENKSISYMWVYQSGRSEPKQIVQYKYEPSRKHEHAVEYLTGYKGILSSDGYGAYDKIEGAYQTGCWAHCRRYFKECVDLIPKTANKLETISYNCLVLINKLFKIEKDNDKCGYSYQEIKEIRIKESKPIVEKFYELVKERHNDSIGKTHLGKALTYAINQEKKLRSYLEDGRIEISNNRCENSIRPFCVGRGNWLFCNTARGAEASANIYSLIETAKKNKLKPQAYLEYLLRELAQIDIENRELVEQYMPWSDKLPKELYESNKKQ